MREKDFVPTQNYQKLEALVEELLGPALGVEMAAVVGRAGRGKTTAAERIYTHNPNTVYVLYEEKWPHLYLLREITFKLCGTRPRFRQQCAEMIENELAARRRIVMIDEADRMNLTCLNVVRNIHDKCHVPVLLIGEEKLSSSLSSERRLIDRVRRTVAFGPITQADISVYFYKRLGLKLLPEQTAKIHKHSQGNFRQVLMATVKAERILKASGLTTITSKVIDEICSEKKGS